MPRNLNKDAGQIQSAIEEINGLNIKCEHSRTHNEGKIDVCDEEEQTRLNSSLAGQEIRILHNNKEKLKKPPITATEMTNILSKHNVVVDGTASLTKRGTFRVVKDKSRINIHPDIKKMDGTPLMLNDIHDSHSFGNGITCTMITLKSGEKVPVTICVFPHSVEAFVNVNITKLKNLIMI